MLENNNAAPNGLGYKHDELFVIEDESQFTLENNNKPKINVIEIGNQKIQIAKLHLSAPDTVEGKTADFDEEIRNGFRQMEDNGHARLSKVEDVNLDTERDAI